MNKGEELRLEAKKKYKELMKNWKFGEEPLCARPEYHELNELRAKEFKNHVERSGQAMRDHILQKINGIE